MLILSGFTDSAIFAISGLYFVINLIVLLILKPLIGNHIRIGNKVLHLTVLILLSIIITFLLLGLITTITRKGLLE